LGIDIKISTKQIKPIIAITITQIKNPIVNEFILTTKAFDDDSMLSPSGVTI
jgi:hypothetical protein